MTATAKGSSKVASQVRCKTGTQNQLDPTQEPDDLRLRLEQPGFAQQIRERAQDSNYHGPDRGGGSRRYEGAGPARDSPHELVGRKRPELVSILLVQSRSIKALHSAVT